jgi:RHS repeat-associated protein
VLADPTVRGRIDNRADGGRLRESIQEISANGILWRPRNSPRGTRQVTYDPWNRLVVVKRAYRNAGGLQNGSQIAEIRYDGLGRRISKAITHSADWNAAYHYYYDGQQMIETRNGSDQVLNQHVWGTRYIDELLQITINDDPADANEDDCETACYALHNANFNVLGLVDGDGDLVERYEYTPYGRRTVYTDAGVNDDRVMAPARESVRVQVSGVDQPYGLCDIGHQGLMHDKEFALIYNRARYLHPWWMQFISRDPARYVDGMNALEYVKSAPVNLLDPRGWQSKPQTIMYNTEFDPVQFYGWIKAATRSLGYALRVTCTEYDKCKKAQLRAVLYATCINSN